MTESRALTRSHLLIVDVPRDVPTFSRFGWLLCARSGRPNDALPARKTRTSHHLSVQVIQIHPAVVHRQ